MVKRSEISALLRLIDDPDQEVYETVAGKIMGYGPEMIPPLESLWETTLDAQVQKRIEELIHQVQFQELLGEFRHWARSASEPDLLKGAIFLARYAYPELRVPYLLQSIDRLRRNIWIELNHYLTPLEQVNVFNSILYHYFRMEGESISKRNPEHYFINLAMERKKGNVFAIGILYLSLCELLDLPIYALDLPQHFILVYMDSRQNFFQEEVIHQAQFYIDPLQGMIYTRQDLNQYLKELGSSFTTVPDKTLSSLEVIRMTMESLGQTYAQGGQEQKAEDIRILLGELKR